MGCGTFPALSRTTRFAAFLLDNPWTEPPEEAFQWTCSPEKSPSEPEYIEIDFEEGAPVDHKRGQAFKVRNYRIIRGNFFLKSGTETPSRLTILVYDASGTQVLNKVFAIESAS